jgi:hypothetical protein
VAAKRRLDVGPDGSVALPRIVVRRPRRGDIHPISAASLRGVLKREVPIEYLNGLTRIELRPRQGIVGDPFACYLPDEKAIILYSLPMEWTWDYVPPTDLIAKMFRFFALIEQTDDGLNIRWPAREVFGLWFFVAVVAHELAHHYRRQYRIRRGSLRDRRYEEFVAELHSERFFAALRKRYKRQNP